MAREERFNHILVAIRVGNIVAALARIGEHHIVISVLPGLMLP